MSYHTGHSFYIPYVCMYVFMYACIHVSIYHLCIYLCIYVSMYLSIYLSIIYLPIYLSVYLSIYLSVYLSLISLCLFVKREELDMNESVYVPLLVGHSSVNSLASVFLYTERKCAAWHHLLVSYCYVDTFFCSLITFSLLVYHWELLLDIFLFAQIHLWEGPLDFCAMRTTVWGLVTRTVRAYTAPVYCSRGSLSLGSAAGLLPPYFTQ